MTDNLQNYYSENCTYNINTHCNLVYALKIWDYLNFIRERMLFIFSN